MVCLWNCLAVITLPLSASPQSSTLIAVESFQISGGNGNSAIEFNECASLNVHLRNNDANALIGVVARLSTSTLGALVWHGDSAYPDIPGGGGAANLTPFHIQTSADLACGTVIDLTLTVTSVGRPGFIIPFQMVAGSAGPAVSVDSGDVPKTIPNLASADSVIDISGIAEAISKITVALRVKHTFDSDLKISLISPDGTKVELSSGSGGFRGNYGSSCSSPMVFDDTAPISIRAGANPLAGTYRPEQALAAFNGKSGSAVNGTWKLRVQDNARSDITAIQCWTLTLTSSTCSDGGGVCNQPPTVNIIKPANNTAFVASSNAPASSLLNGLMAYWKNDEVTGARVDSIGSNHLININASVDSAFGQIGNAAHFSGASRSFLSAPNDSSLSFSNESFTISAWVKLSSKAGGSCAAVSKSQNEYALRYDNVSGRFTFTVDGLDDSVAANSLVSPLLNVWYYVVAWYDSTNRTKNIQVNNGLVNSAAHTTRNPITTNDFYLGSIGGFNDLWNGDIDEVKIWRRVLTGSERASDYNNGVAETPLTSSRAVVGVYVSPNGRSNGNGSINDPTDLLTALGSTTTRAQPGSTIWLRGGTYLYRSRIYSDIAGLANQPITIRSYPGEWAVIDGWLTVNGGNLVMRNFELMNSSTSRGNADVQDGFVIHAANSKFINLVVHDCIGDGIEFWSGAVNSELNGCLMYRNGYYDPVEARPRGHNLYTQNSTGTKLIKDNISFDAYDHGIHPYTAQNSITGFRFVGNVAFNNGVSQYQSIGRPNFFIGAQQPVKDVIFDGNYSYHTLGVPHSGNDFGWSGALNTNITIINNYFVGGNSPAQLDNFTGPIIFTNNILVGAYNAAILTPVAGVPFSTYTWDSNHYYSRRDAGLFDFVVEGLVHKTFPAWKLTTGFDANSTYVNSFPTGTKIVVLPNDYEPGRANIVVYNWNLNPTVAVDVGGAIAIGTRYEVKNVRDFSGPPVASGTYTGGSITLPMAGTANGPLFNTFVLTPLSQISSSLAARVANPAEDRLLTIPAVALSASASDVDGTVSKVELFDGDSLIGTATASPYNLTWKDVPLGLHEIVAVATDDGGSATISSPVQITVSPGASQSGFITSTTLGTLRKSLSGWLGMRISVGADPLTITDLGRFCLSGNQAKHILKLVSAMDGSDVAGGTVAVSMSGGRVGDFTYAALPNPVTLQPNTSYYVVSQEANGGDQWPLSDGSINTTSVANCDGPVYDQFLSDSVTGWIFSPRNGHALGLVDFKYLIGEVLPARIVNLTQPSGSGVLSEPANIALEADAWYKLATVTKVEFFEGENLLGLTASSPYRLSWNNVAAGNYIITARATGSDGVTALSHPVTITVNPAGNLSPIVSIISPTNNAAFIAPASLALACNAKDSDGNVAKVEFFDESGLIGTATASPFSLVWNNVTAGTYTITARATDNVGAVTYSSPVQIAVNPPANVAPTITITSPIENTILAAPGSMTLSADATDSDGTISKVQFFQGSALLGTVTQSPYIFIWNTFSSGEYSITAKAMDNGGEVTVSRPIRVTVKPASMSVESFSTSGGNGNGFLDFNECAALDVILRNSGTSVLRGVAATLSARSAGVNVWQAKSAYPDIPIGAVMANTVPFSVLTAPDFVCGSAIDFTLTVTTSGGAAFVLPFKAGSGSLSAAVSFSATDVPKAIPDPGSVDSAVLVGGVTGALVKVTVGLQIHHPFDSDLQVSLIAPDGTTVNLSTANGGHQDDIGTSCSALTLFDDDAPKAISESNAPFIGAFRADQPLSLFNGKSGLAVNGIWKLRVTDGVAADAGSIECWVLNLTPSTCSDGGGPCNNAPTLSVASSLKGPTFKAPLGVSSSPLLNGIVAYWKNDEVAGARVDSIGNNHLININGLVGSSTGKIGKAAHFSGSSGSFLFAPNDSSLSFNNESFTVSAWVKLNSKSGGPCSAVSKSRYEYALRYDDGPDRLTFVLNGLNSSVAANGLGSPSLNAWYYVVAWYDSTNLTKNIQVNNGPVSSAPHTTGIHMTTNDFYFGSIEGFNDLWNGDIDEVKIWQRVLTGPERTSDYNSGVAGTPLTSSAAVTDFYVSPNGRVDGDGSFSDPTDLLTALEKTTSRAQPGSTIWLRGGTYLYRSRIYSNIAGLANQPITIRSYPGEWAVIDGWMNVSGNNIVMRNFELMNSNTRNSANVQDGFVIVAANSKFINLVIHDCIGDGVELWSPALNAELNGCVIYRNGWYDPVQARPRGHNIYTQNTTGIKLIKDNITFLAYDHGIHPYTASNSITGYVISRNIAFNNGITPQSSIGKPNLFCGGLQPVMNVTFDQNYSYHALGVAHSGNDFGWLSSLNTNINIINNYFVGGGSPLQVDFFTGPIICTNNTLVGYFNAVDFTPAPGIPYSRHTWNKNTYFNREDNGNINCIIEGLVPKTFAQWKSTTGWDANSTYTASLPTGTKAVVLPNDYEPGRANIVVYNWNLNSTVAVDVSSAMAVGTRYEVRNVLNFFGPPVASGTYAGGSITLPMTGTATGPLFNTFVLLPVWVNASPTVVITSPSSGSILTGPVNISVNTTPSDSDGTIRRVEFFNGATLIGSTTTAPFNLVWNNVGQGSYTITAMVTDDDGAVGSSAPVNITVVPQPNLLPTVGITGPANGATFAEGANVIVSANASDADGTVAKIDFYRGTSLLASVTNAPYNFTWVNLPPGAHTLTAKAIDNLGGVMTSAPVNITVNGGSQAEFVNTTTLGATRNDFNGWLGMKFTVGSSPITVISLGRYYYSGNSATHTVKIVKASNGIDVVNGSVAIAMGGVPAGQFKYATLAASVILSANTSYYLVSQETPGGDVWANENTTITTKSVAACNGSMFGSSGSWTFRAGANTAFGPLDFIYATANQAPTVSITSPPNGAAFATPANITVNSTANDSDGTIIKVELFNGSALLGTDTASPYNFVWNNVGVGSYTLTAKATDNTGVVTTSSPINITVNPLANQSPAVSITSPANGATFTAPANITVNSTASDSDGTISKVELFNGITLLGTDTGSPFSFTWNNVAAGSYTLTAKATDNAGAVTTSNPISITVSAGGSQAAFVTGATLGSLRNDFNGWLGMKFTVASPLSVTALGRYVISGNSRTHTVKLVNASNGTDVPNGSVSIALSGATAGQFKYVGLSSPITLLANTSYYVVSQESPGGDDWADESTTVTTSGVASCDGAILNSASWLYRPPANTTFVPVNFMYTPPNQAPVVSITSPASGAAFTTPANINVNTTATDTDGTISKVELFNGSTLLGTDTTSPYNFPWNNVAAGSYTLTAKATDNTGAVTTSSPINITVNPPANQPPVVSITSPANGATFTGPANITVNSTASDSDGTITKVELFNGGTLLGTDTTSPYNFSWNNVAVGSYTLTAKATDNTGAVTTSSPINITVNPPANQSPTVSISSPANGATFIAPANITVNSTANDSDGTISKVELFDGSTLLGTDTGSPFSFSWNNVAAGSYTLTAKATDNAGAVTTSSPINITVNAGGSQTAFVTGVTLGALRNDFNGWLGMKFTVGASPLSVTALGRYVISGNSRTHTVKLVNASNGTDVPNGSVSIALSGATAGQFKYVGLGSPITLLANTAYYVVCQESPGGDDWADESTAVTTSGAASCDGSILSTAGWRYRPPANTTFVPVNFMYGSPNQAPVVSITSPASGATFTAPANISFTATASDSDGTISTVELFNGSTLVDTEFAAPYNFNWNNVAPGSYTLT
ncbi:MAG: Ig-like domain-containing protein, partial [Verrucomicrobiota bacterium]